ncbi:MAG TPA: hypothetical protein VH415_03470 [Nitrososphaeraceae archaeon]
MLGEIIGEMKGKISSQRVLDSEGPEVETNISASGSLRGVQVTETLTYVASPSARGILHGVGEAVVISEKGEMATFRGEGIGRFDSSGTLKWRGAVFFKPSSSGELQFLNNLVAAFEAEVDAQGNFSDKTWEWK